MIEEVGGTCGTSMGRTYCNFMYGGIRKTCLGLDGRVTLKWMLVRTGKFRDLILMKNGIDTSGELLRAR
jgi:hypothetical protein